MRITLRLSILVMVMLSWIATPTFAKDKSCVGAGIEVSSRHGLPIALVANDAIQEVSILATGHEAEFAGARGETQNVVTKEGAKASDGYWYFANGQCYQMALGKATRLGGVNKFKASMTLNNSKFGFRHGVSLVIVDAVLGSRKSLSPGGSAFSVSLEGNSQIVYLKPDGWQPELGADWTTMRDWVEVDITPGQPNVIDMNAIDWNALFMVRVSEGGKFKKTNFTRKVKVGDKGFTPLLYSYHFTLLPPGEVVIKGEDGKPDQTEEDICDISEDLMEQIVFENFNPFTDEPPKDASWAKNSELGQCGDDDDFANPRIYRIGVGFRF